MGNALKPAQALFSRPARHQPIVMTPPHGTMRDACPPLSLHPRRPSPGHDQAINIKRRHECHARLLPQRPSAPRHCPSSDLLFHATQRNNQPGTHESRGGEEERGRGGGSRAGMLLVMVSAMRIDDARANDQQPACQTWMGLFNTKTFTCFG